VCRRLSEIVDEEVAAMEDYRCFAKEGNQYPQSPRSSSEPVRVEELMDRIGGDLDLLSHLLSIFVQDYDQCVTRIQDAIRVGDGETLHRWAHRIKGALGNFAAHGAYEIAQRLEQAASSGDLSCAEMLWGELQAEIRSVRSALEFVARR